MIAFRDLKTSLSYSFSFLANILKLSSTTSFVVFPYTLFDLKNNKKTKKNKHHSSYYFLAYCEHMLV